MSQTESVENYFIKEGYISRVKPECLVNRKQGIIYQPNVYSLAHNLAKKFDSNYIINIGCRNSDELASLYKHFNIIGIDSKDNLKIYQEKYPKGICLEYNLDSAEELSIPKDYLINSVIVCTGVIEELISPEYLLEKLKRLMNHAAICLISTPERDLMRGADDFGPPVDLSHIREWNLDEFENLLNYFDFNLEFTGLTVNNHQLKKETILSIIGNNSICLESPNDFKVTAIMTVFNEEDIIYHSIKRLLDQDIQVYIIDNWSTDSSFEIIEKFKGSKNFLRVERFPHSQASQTFDLTKLLQRIEELSMTLETDWFIHHDADEIRMAPWNTNLKDGIFYVDRLGYNAIDHTVVNFQPTDNRFLKGDYEKHFRYFEFGKHQSSFRQVKAWKKTDQRVGLASSAGHSVKFNNRKVCPYKFINKHYPIRSQEQGERKIFKHRKPRWNPQERKWGWHVHYDHIQPGYSFLKDKDNLNKYINDNDFRSRYLVELISGVGIIR